MKVGTLALLVEDGHLWLARRKEKLGEGFLGGPGGKQEPGESLTECLLRETKKEWGITLNPQKLEEVARITFHVASVPSFQVHVFLVRGWEGTPCETEDAHTPTRFPLSSIPYEDMFEGDRFWFMRAIEGERFKANVYYRKEARELEREPEFFPADF